MPWSDPSCRRYRSDCCPEAVASIAGRREGVDDAIEFMEQQQARERRLVAETMRSRAAGAPLFTAILQRDGYTSMDRRRRAES